MYYKYVYLRILQSMIACRLGRCEYEERSKYTCISYLNPKSYPSTSLTRIVGERAQLKMFGVFG
jgi:hypothetical protein